MGEKEATDISSLNFTVDDIEALQAEARVVAIEDAKAKAEVLASQLGVRVVRLTSYYEEGADYSQPMYNKTMAFDERESVGFGGAEMPVGEDSTKVRVNVTYEVK